MTGVLKVTFMVSILLLGGCNSDSHKETFADDDNVAVASQFIDAFYSFDRDSLETILSDAKGSQPNILYYQKWAECGNYEIVKRSECIIRNDSLVTCPVTVKDDLMAALNIDFNVTDSFHITLRDGQIRSIETSSNDPAVYFEAKEWVKQNRAELVNEPCEGIWEGGATPCECINGMINGFTEFSSRQ